MSTKNKGFTLIELLAVILILGIISLIAIPVVNNILKSAKEGSFSNTIDSITAAVENDCIKSKMNNNKDYDVDIDKLELNGYLPKEIDIDVDSSCKVYLKARTDDYCALKTYNDEYAKKGNVNDMSCISNNNVTVYNDRQDSTCFTFDSSTKTITGYNYDCGKNIVIPDKIGDVPVENIDKFAFARYDVVMYDGMNAYLMENAGYASDLTTTGSTAMLTLPFYKKDLTKVYYLGNGDIVEKSIDDKSYTYNINGNTTSTYYLVGIKVNGESFANFTKSKQDLADILDLSYATNLKKIGEAAFFNIGLNKIIFPIESNISSLGKTCFGANDLTSVDLSSLHQITSPSTGMFYYNNINNIKFSNEIQYLNPYMFAYNTGKIDSLDISNYPNLTKIYNLAFFQSKSFKNVIINNNPKLTNIDMLAFQGAGIDSLIIKNNPLLSTLGNQAFAFNDINSIKLENNPKLTKIPDGCFAYIKAKEITIPSTITSIVDYAFVGTNFEKITIEGNATRFNTRWTNIGFPSNLKPVS